MRLVYYFCAPQQNLSSAYLASHILYVQLNIVQVYSSATQTMYHACTTARLMKCFFPDNLCLSIPPCAAPGNGLNWYANMQSQYRKAFEGNEAGQLFVFGHRLFRRRALIVRWRTKINLRCNAEK